MNWSRAEIAALAGKAARGGGAPAAQAALFGQAVAVHLARARSGEEVAAALHALPGGPIVAFALDITRLEQARATAPEAVVELSAPASLLQSYFEAQGFVIHERPPPSGILHVGPDQSGSGARPPIGRIDAEGALIALMSDLAARTFVPDSDASRRAGAGAGLSDND